MESGHKMNWHVFLLAAAVKDYSKNTAKPLFESSCRGMSSTAMDSPGIYLGVLAIAVTLGE